MPAFRYAVLIMFLIVSACVVPVSAQGTALEAGEIAADEAPQAAPDAAPEAAEDPRAVQEREADEAYREVAAAYLANDWDALPDMFTGLRRHQRFLDRQQRNDVTYMRRAMKDFQPRWWAKCASSANISFKAELWSRPLTANYMPTRALGVQAMVPETEWRKNRQGEYEPVITSIKVIVSWKPGMVNSPSPASGKLADIHGVTLGDISEVIVWHELGHCYITNYLPLKHVVTLYEEYDLLFRHLQEFYADLTSLYHASPRSRRVMLIFRLEGLDHYNDAAQHDRAAHAIGALLLHEILANPDDWPSFHLPPAVPGQQVELNTIIYLYEHMEPEWSVKEARALRELAGDFIKKSGEKTLRAKGVLQLASRHKFSLMVGQDHKLQAERDEYVAAKLESLIAAGRADTLEAGATYDPPVRRPLPQGEEPVRDPEALRIDIPL
jgi:hypothetical protein